MWYKSALHVGVFGYQTRYPYWIIGNQRSIQIANAFFPQLFICVSEHLVRKTVEINFSACHQISLSCHAHAHLTLTGLIHGSGG